MTVPSAILDTPDEMAQRLEARPQELDAGFAVALACQDSAKLRDQADDFADHRDLGRRFLLVENEGASPFRFGK